ncbi:MAG: class I SAM-dependent methyltransferase [Deltaproteobacteria bacterium]|nr:class I SAM-dependent methyltransferase [Deltaproteobacteria bacterium]
MSRLVAAIYDRFMAESERACLQQWRAELLSGLTGRVLELGAGTGANLVHYPTTVELVLAEPDRHMRRRLQRRVDTARVELAEYTAEAIAAERGSFDAVVGTLLLCTVPDAQAVLDEVARVLKPGGQYLFIEHVAADSGTGRRRWQRRLEPFWRRLADGCKLTCDTESTLRSQPELEMESIERTSMRKALPWLRPTIRGTARRA